MYISISFSGLNARNKWKGLRDKFRITLASMPTSTFGDPQLGEWKYFQSLLFLKDQFNLGLSKTTIPKKENENTCDDENETDDTYDSQQSITEELETLYSPLEHTDSLAPSSFTPSNTSEKRRKIENSANDDMGHALLDADWERNQYREEQKMQMEEDEDLNFFKSLLPHVRTFSAYDKMEYRIKIMKLNQDFLNPN